MAGILIFIPTFNDFAHLSKIVAEIRKTCTDDNRILIVDDGSSLSLEPGSLDANVLSVRLPNNYGLGVCTHIAFDHALRHGYRALVRLDADGQHPAERIPDLVGPLDRDAAVAVVGVRTNRDDDAGAFTRRLVSRYFALISRLVTRGRTPVDVNTGFFALSRAAIEKLNVGLLERFPEPQIFVAAGRAGLRVSEVPVTQLRRSHGTSTLNIFAGLRMFYRFNMMVLSELLQRRR